MGKSKWIKMSEKISFSTEEWNRVFSKYKFVKQKYASIFDKKLREVTTVCIFTCTGADVGKKIISVRGMCKQDGCRRYKFNIFRSSLTDAVKVFDIYRSSGDQVHPDRIVRYLTGFVRNDKAKEIISNTPDVFHGIEALKVDLDIMENNNLHVSLVDVYKKLHSENLASRDNAVDDITDINIEYQQPRQHKKPIHQQNL